MREKIFDLLQKRYYTDEDIQALGSEAVLHVIALFDEDMGELTEIYRQAMVYMLGVLGGEQAAAFLIRLFHGAGGTDETLQMAAASALARTDHETALAVVLPLLTAKDKRLRKNIIMGLRTSRRDEVLAQLKSRAKADSDESIRQYARKVADEIEARLNRG